MNSLNQAKIDFLCLDGVVVCTYKSTLTQSGTKMKVKSFVLNDVAPGKYNTISDRYSKLKYPQFYYNDCAGNLREMTVNKVSSKTLSLRCKNNRSCNARLTVGVEADILKSILVGKRTVYSIEHEHPEVLLKSSYSAELYHKCTARCSSDCSKFEHSQSCPGLHTHKSLQRKIRSTSVTLAQQQPNLKQSDVFRCVDVKFNLSGRPNGKRQVPSHMGDCGIQRTREYWAMQYGRSKQDTHGADSDQIPADCKTLETKGPDGQPRDEVFVTKYSDFYLLFTNYGKE